MPLATALINNATRYMPSAEVALFYLVEATLHGGLLTLVMLPGNGWPGLRRARSRRMADASHTG